MFAHERGSRRFFISVVSLFLLVASMLAVTSSQPTLAGLPEQEGLQPEPIHIRLKQPLTGASSDDGGVSIAQAGVAAAPGAWYNLMAEEFDSGTFPPASWAVDTDSGAGWAQQTTEQVSGAYSAGVEMNTAGTLDTRLIYGGGSGFAVQNVADAKLNFNFWLDTEKDGVYFAWAASADGQNFYGARVSGQVGAWLTGELDMRQYSGDSSVWIAFFVSGDASTDNSVYIDNVTVQGLEPYKLHLPAVLNNYSPPATSFTFTDDFSNTGSGWPHILQWGSTPAEQGYITGYLDKFVADYPGDYSIVGGSCRENPQTYFMRNGEWADKIIAKPGLTAGSQFVMEADIAFCDDALFASTGFVFGLNEASSEFYRVILIYDPGGGGTIKYAVWRNSIVLVNTSPSSHLNGGYNSNHVKIVRDGCNISLYFNDNLEWSTSSECDYKDEQRQVGFFHDRYPNHGNTGATLDNFRLEGAMQAAGSSQKVIVWTTEVWPSASTLEGVDYITATK